MTARCLRAIILAFAGLASLTSAGAADVPSPSSASAPASGPVYVLPIEGPISRATIYPIRRGVKEALARKASALVIRMDTPGGEVAATEEIMDILARFEPADRTYTFVVKDAYSAGAFIAAGTRHIYMQPGSVIGAATPVTMGQDGVNELPPKIVSAIAAKVRTAAERNGHDTAVFDAMVNKQVGLVKDGKQLVGKGDILTLTDKEASTPYGNPPKPLLSAGTIDSLETLLVRVGLPGAPVVVMEPTGWEKISSWIVAISPLLLSAALLCAYLEFKTPGFGIFGITGIVCALVFFFGHYVAGLSGYEFVLLFLLGVALIAAELFLLPGTIVPGLLGAALVLLALLKAMVDRYPTDPFLPTLPQLQLPVTNLLMGLGFSLAAILFLARILPRSPIGHALVLDAVNATELPVPLNAPTARPGQAATGTSLSYLRPVGTADFGQGPIEVTTEGEFIEQGKTLRIVRVEGNRIVVEAV
ncbi:MAG: serine protease [Candidatus Methylacidiphilales bacterium]|nr:serine protease [Candidatus Methylacidiphilales bacterium]